MLKISNLFKKTKTDSKKKDAANAKANNQVVAIAADITGKCYDDVLKEMNYAKEHFGISYYEFTKGKLFGADDKGLAEAQANITSKKENRIADIAEAMRWSREKALEEYDKAKAKFGVTLFDYHTGRFYAFNDEEILAKIEQKKNNRSKRLEEIIKQSGWSKAKVKRHMQYCDLKWGIQSKAYLKYRCWEKQDSELEETAKQMVLDNRNLIGRVFAEKENLSYDEAMEILQDAQEKYGIRPYIFVKRNLYHADESQKIEAGTKQKNKYNIKLNVVARRMGQTFEEAEERYREVYNRYKIAPSLYCQDRLYKYTNAEIEEIQKNSKEKSEEILSMVIGASGWTEDQVAYHMKKCDLLWGIDADHYRIFRCWEYDDEEISEYVTQTTSAALLRKYSGKDLTRLDNKVLFNENFKEFIKRKYWINTKNASLESFKEFVEGLDEFILKPMDSSMAIGVRKVKVAEDVEAQYEEIMSEEACLLEEVVRQHDEINRLYPGCVNTCRLVTVLKDDIVYPICAVMKVGNGGAAADNLVRGGMAVGIDLETGVITTNGVDVKGNIYECHPATGVKFIGFQIPNWEAVLDIADRAMRVLPEVGYCGWDIAITPEGAAIIEGNGKPDIGLCQTPYAHQGVRIKNRFEAFL